MRPTSGYMTIKISNGQKLSLFQASVTKVVDQKENEIDKKNISIELHSHQFIEDRVEMKKVQTLDPDEQGVIELKRGGNHLMIYHLPRKELKFLYIQLTFRDPKGYESHEIICFPVRPIDSIECCSNGNAK